MYFYAIASWICTSVRYSVIKIRRHARVLVSCYCLWMAHRRMKHLRQHRPIRLSGNKTKGVNYALYVSRRWRPSTRAIVREKERIPEIDRPRCKNSLGRIVWVDLWPYLVWNAHFGSMHHSCFRSRASKRIFLRWLSDRSEREFLLIIQGCYRPGKSGKSWKIEEIEIDRKNQEKSGKNCKKVWNFKICSQFP